MYTTTTLICFVLYCITLAHHEFLQSVRISRTTSLILSHLEFCYTEYACCTHQIRDAMIARGVGLERWC
jgi:hypothetical protein